MLSLTFPVGSEWYAVDFDWIREVVEGPTVTAIPTAPPAVLGLFNLRGEMVPLFDTGRLLGIDAVAATPFVVVVDTPAGLAGLVATGLPVAVQLAESLGPGDGPAAVGVYPMEGSVATLLDVDALVVPGRVQGAAVE